MDRRFGVSAVCVGFVAFSMWWLTAGEPPGRDQGLFAAQAQALLDGAPLYTGIWEHKPPGVIAAYAAAQAVFGRGFEAVHLLDGAALLATALGLAALVGRHARSGGALLAGLLYALYQGGPPFGGFWATAQAEGLMDPLLVAALALWLRADGRLPSPARAAGAGALVAGIAALKLSALTLALLPLPALLWSAEPARARARAAAAFAGGLATPVLLGALWLAATGRLDEFWSANVRFNLAHAPIDALPRTDDLLAKGLYRLDLLLPLYLGALLAGIAAALDSARPAAAGAPERAGARRLAGWALWTWALALAGVFWQAKFWVYHYHVVLAPLALAAGVGWSAMVDRVARAPLPGRARRVAAPAALVVVLLPGALLAPYLIALDDYLRDHRLRPAQRGEIGWQGRLATYRWGASDYDAFDTWRAAARLAAETDPEERLFVWGFEPALYVWAGRRPASRFFYDYPLMPRFGALHVEHLALLLEDLRRTPPARFVVVHRDANDIEPAPSDEQLRAIPELEAFLEAGYEPAWRQGDFEVWRRRAGADAGDG